MEKREIARLVCAGAAFVLCVDGKPETRMECVIELLIKRYELTVDDVVAIGTEMQDHSEAMLEDVFGPGWDA